MDSDQDMLDAVTEAALIGMSEASVSRYRKMPSHPATGPNARPVRVGKRLHVKVPRAEVLAWWPPAGSGLSPAGWLYLRSVAAGEPDPDLGTPRVVSVLRAKGLLNDAGKLTDAARALLAPTAAASGTTTD